jgi:hypothetical protein
VPHLAHAALSKPADWETDLARVKDLQQRRVDDQGLRISHKLGYDGASQGFEESPELADAAV